MILSFPFLAPNCAGATGDWPTYMKDSARTGITAQSESEVFAALSARERQILAHLVDGETNQAIGQSLFISEKTVRNHITRVFAKLGVGRRAQAMVLARENGFRV